MKNIRITILAGAAAIAFLSCTPERNTRDKELVMSRKEYTDRVKAMWLGQIIAVHMGWDFEHKPAAVKPVDGYTESRYKKIIENGGAEVDDDWYYEMVALEGFEKYGTDMSVDELGQQWLDYNMGTWGSAFYTRKALLEGKPGSETGLPQNNRMWFTVGNQNRSDLYAMITPGMVNATTDLSKRLGRVNSYAEGTDGGILMGAMESMAFYTSDIRKLMKEAVKVLDPRSAHRQCFEMIIQMGEAGKSWQETALAIETRYGLVYPATNSAVWNAGFAGLAMWYGNGDFRESVNIGYMASDYSDADCSAANVATILGAMYGTSVFPVELIEPFNNRIKGKMLGFMELTEAIDLDIDTLTARTVETGLNMLASLGAKISEDSIWIKLPDSLKMQEYEWFDPNDFTKFWNPEWKMQRAGFGAPGGGVRGVRGGTFVDGDILSTYPYDEIRGVKLYRSYSVKDKEMLRFEVAADPGRIWRLKVYIDNEKEYETLVDGGKALEWEGIGPGSYPQPLHEYDRSKEVRKWQSMEIDLSAWKGQDVVIRLYQDNLVNNGFPGNGYWRKITIGM